MKCLATRNSPKCFRFFTRVVGLLCLALFCSPAAMITQDIEGLAEPSNPDTSNSVEVRVEKIHEADGNFTFDIELKYDGESMSIEGIEFPKSSQSSPMKSLRIRASSPKTIAFADFDLHQAIFQYISGFAGYQDAEGTQFKLGHQLKFRRRVIEGFGVQGSKALAGVIDTTNLRVPESASMNFLGCGVGMTLGLNEEISDADLSRIKLSFDAAVRGCKSLDHTKVLVGFAVDKGKHPEGGEGPSNARFDDILCKLIRGDKCKEELLTITNEIQHFEFNLGEDFAVHAGKLENLQRVTPQRIAFILQAAGKVEDTGTDENNQIIVDNVRFSLLPKASD